uniref:fatty acid amide hydrolase n=1 Tax=Elaeophora elaphi TaxID=1147741 RepID=A0A0R3S0Y5_9BILA
MDSFLIKFHPVVFLNNFLFSECLQSGKFTAKEVLRTYQENAINAHHKTNCIESEKWAEELDKKAEDENYQKPPLFGIPVSVKESIQVKGYPQTQGFANELKNIADDDSIFVQQIKELGGIPFVLTNIPQSMLSFSCVNPIYGTTTNPYASTKTCGGSTGGEAALISLGGSIIGMGTDVGGSIRYPCHFCGIAGLKPSHLRLSHQGIVSSIPGRTLINSSSGPMAKCATDLVTFLRIIWSGKWIWHHDPYTVPIDWDEKQFNDKIYLLFFPFTCYYYDDGWFKPTPALQRAVYDTISILEGCGHTMVKFEPPNIPEAFKCFIGAMLTDGGKYLLDRFNKDLIGEGFEMMVYYFRIPGILKRVLGKLLTPFYPRIGQFLCSLPLDTSELRQTYGNIEAYRELYIKRMQELRIDALVCPVQVLPAVEHHIAIQLTPTTSYCGIFNLLDFAAGTVHITKVNEDDEKELDAYPENDVWYKTVKQATKGSIGLPVGVQIAVPPYYEETALRIMCDIEQHSRMSNL